MIHRFNLYQCQICNLKPERYRAKDNVPTYAHVCAGCFLGVPTDVKTHYVDTSIIRTHQL